MAAGLLLLVVPAFAVDWLSLELGQLEGPDWRAENVSIEIDWQTANNTAFRLSASSLSHPALPSPIKAFKIDCREGVVTDLEIRCRKGRLHLQHPSLDQPGFGLDFRYRIAEQRLELALHQVKLVGGVLDVEAHSSLEGWQLGLRGKGLDVARLQPLLEPHLDLPEGLELAAVMDLSLSLAGHESELSRGRYDISLTDGAFSDADALYLADGVALEASGELSREGMVWQGSEQLSMAQGALLTPFFYMEAGEQPVSLKSGFVFDPEKQRLELTGLKYRHPGILALDLSAELVLGENPAVQALHLHAPSFEVQSLYQGYIQPTQAENLLARLEWGGQAAMDVDYVADGAQRLTLNLHELSVDEVPPPPPEGELAPRRSFGLYGVNGNLVWSQGREPETTRLAWEGGHLLESISLGQTRMELELQGQQARLLQPTEIALMDGSLALRRLNISQGEQGPKVEFDGALTPISMETFSQAMGWPTLAGTLSGGISGASYENGSLTVGGSIVTNIFDGWVAVRNLRLVDMFGIWPQLYADLEFKELDLQTLTSTFSFGKITGKLEGQIDQLYMENWKPVSFDARFATPEDDDSRHRISQRAVDNISNLGGSGVAGALSRSFLRFFEEFGYDRLGISCRLKNGVCEMGGVGPAKQGYYLVKGGGVPRIDIVGFNRRIDWELLVQKLIEITESGEPVVQ